jgi:hypothetical protein
LDQPGPCQVVARAGAPLIALVERVSYNAAGTPLGQGAITSSFQGIE